MTLYEELAENWDPDDEDYDGRIGYLIIPGFGLFTCEIPINPYKKEEYNENSKLDVRIIAYIDLNGEIRFVDGFTPDGENEIENIKNGLVEYKHLLEKAKSL